MSAATAGAGPLDGLRVLDLSTSVAGFQAGQVLSDFGADVVHVEPPGGSPLRALPSYPFLARGRKSIVLDLKQAADVAVAQQLGAGADVVIETFRPGVTERLGLGFDTLAATNHGLVYASITGFGRTGPYADVQGYEALVIARLGGLSVSGGMVERPGPAHVSAPWASYGATQLALTGILSALHERERSGFGQRVDTSLVQGVAGQGPYNWFLRVIADRYPDAFNFTPPFSDAGVPNDGVFFMLLIALTKDGRWMQFAQVQPHLFRAFIEKVDLAWMYDDPHWSSIPRFETEEQRSEFWDILLGKVRERTFDEWQEVFDADHDVWAEIFRRGSELLDHPQIVHLGAAVEIDDPAYGRVRQPGPLVQMSATPAPLGAPTPALDEHGAALRSDPWPSRDAAAADGAPTGRALDGVTVLELGSFYAAPYGATILADLGAKVVKVEPLTGEPIRFLLPFPESGAIKVLQGKESIALDLETTEGRAIVHDIARKADIVLMSYRAGVAERQGIDDATLRAVNPDLVYLTCPGYGADGPCGDRPAYAPSIGAGSGLAMRNMGGIVPERPDLDHADVRANARKIFGSGTAEYAQADGISAMSVATAMALGLLVRDRVGVGQHLLASMLTSSAQMLCDDLTVYDGRPPTVAPDAELYGFGARYRLYEASDGWIYLAAPQPHEWPRLVAAIAVEADLAADDRFADEAGRVANDGALADVLATAIHTRPAAFWESHCRAHDVGCVEVAMRTPEAELLDDSFGRASGWVTDVEHPMLGEHPRLTPLVALSRSGGVAGPGVLIGEQTDQVLTWLGYDAARIADLRDRRVVG